MSRGTGMHRLSRMGQVTVEYFILFAIVAEVTLLGLTTFDEDVRKTCTDFFNAAATDVVAQR